MTSKDNKIQKLYQKLESFNEYVKNNKKKLKRDISQHKNNLKDSIDTSFPEYSYKTANEVYLQELLGFTSSFLFKSGIKDPLKTIYNTNKIDSLDSIWTNNCYHIIFINENIRIRINKSQINSQYFSVFKNMLDDEKEKLGIEKGLNINFYSDVTGELMDGPYVYITSLDTNMIMLDIDKNQDNNEEKIKVNLNDLIKKHTWYN
tara:strand:+ start:144 stop:755 length:612 start_codon:yes stop_codon:yes gene_type:complete